MIHQNMSITDVPNRNFTFKRVISSFISYIRVNLLIKTMVSLHSFDKKVLLACVVDLDLFVDVIEDGLHLVLQAIQLMSFPLQLPLVFLIALL